jgi:hypothetical protein
MALTSYALKLRAFWGGYGQVNQGDIEFVASLLATASEQCN